MKRLRILDFTKIITLSFRPNVTPVRLYKKVVPLAFKFVARICFHAVGVLCIGNTFCTVFGYPASVDGNSMTPTINKEIGFCSDWVFVNCWAARHSKVERGEIVVFNSPVDPSTFVIKRVLALENDIVQNRRNLSQTVIPKGHCWVEGDNIKISADSASYGPISTGLIFGKATHIIFPPKHWKRLVFEIPQELGQSIVSRCQAQPRELGA